MTHQGLLDLLALHSAAHKEILDRPGSLIQYDKADDPIVAELVAAAHDDATPLTVGSEPLQVEAGELASPIVELVGTLRQLEEARHALLADVAQLEHQVAACQESQEILGSVAESNGPLFLLAVHESPPLALLRRRQIELRACQKIADVGDAHSANHGKCATDLFQLKGLVVDKEKRVKPDIERCGDLLYALALGIPVDLRVQEVLCKAELLQRNYRFFEIVLARDRLQHPSPIELDDYPCDLGSNPDTERSQLDQGAVPQCVVEIPDHAFHLGRSLSGDRLESPCFRLLPFGRGTA